MCVKSDKYDLKHELDSVYMTKDGKRFLNIDQAIEHQISLIKIQQKS